MRYVSLCVGILLWLLALTSLIGAFELSADMVTRDGTQRQVGKLYVKGNKYRIEMKNASEYAIIRHDKNKSWIVIPERKAYIEMPFDPKKRPAIEESRQSEGNRTYLGSEVIEGQMAKKYRVTTNGAEQDESFYQWIAMDTDFPVKTMAADGSWSVEYSNIRGTVSDGLFELPEAYEKLTMPPADVGEFAK